MNFKIWSSCDRGKSFESKLISELADRHKITIVFSSSYHHSSNEQVERQFRTIRDSIHISLQDKNFSDWTELLPEIEFTNYL